MINIITSDNKSLETGIDAIIRRIANRLNYRSGDVMSTQMTDTVKNWIQQRYPGSKHWDPKKVEKGDSMGVVGVTNVNIPGAGRAFHDVTILPVKAKALTIPIHSSAYGKKTQDFNDLFRPKDKNILARVLNGELIPMFALAKKAFQKQDRFLMPTDDHMGTMLIKALVNDLNGIL